MSKWSLRADVLFQRSEVYCAIRILSFFFFVWVFLRSFPAGPSRIASSHRQMQQALTVQMLQGPLIEDGLTASKKIQGKDVLFIHRQKKLNILLFFL